MEKLGLQFLPTTAAVAEEEEDEEEEHMEEIMETRKVVGQMNINRMLRAENDDRKLKLANETKAKNEEVHKRKVTVKKFKEFKNDAKRENKMFTDTMVFMEEEIIRLVGNN